MKNAHNSSSLGKNPPQFGRLESGIGERVHECDLWIAGFDMSKVKQKTGSAFFGGEWNAFVYLTFGKQSCCFKATFLERCAAIVQEDSFL